MFNVAVELFFDEVDDTKLNHLNQLFINSIKPATTIVRSPYPMTRMKKGLKARVELLEYFQEKSDNIDISKETLFADLVKTNNEEAGLTNFEIAEHMIFLLLAAHDTTTSTLTSSIHFLAGDKSYQNKVKTESSTLSKTHISDLKNGIIGEALFNEAISLTYALPGAVIGLALIIMVTSTPLKSEIMIGSFSLLVYAYVMRYMAVGISPLKSSFEKHPSSYDDTAFNLGMGPFKLFRRIHFPINQSAIAIAFLITFVDIIKELPITLILRPFNFDTLAVQTYQYAIDEMIPKSAVYSLTIVVLGTILLIFLKNIVNKQIDVSQDK